MKKVYKIDCEWDMGFNYLYSTKAKAMKAIRTTDWSDVLEEGESVQSLLDDNMVIITELIVS
jgi:hypothetical protein